MTHEIKILVVDDELRFLDALCRRLKLRGFDVAKAASGEEAIQAARAADYALVLLDLKLPRMDGKEVLRILKQEHRRLEVIVLTGHGSLDSEKECAALGAFAYIPKPFELDHLIKFIKHAYMVQIENTFQGNGLKPARIRKAAGDDSAASGNFDQLADRDHDCY